MAEEITGPNLTQTAYLARNGVKFGLIALVIFMVGRTFISAFAAYWKATHPDPPPPPTVGFGILPQIEFPESEPKPSQYKLETASGRLPEFKDRANVYLMIKNAPSLLDDDRAKNAAARLDFVFAPDIIGNSTYRFTKSQPLQSVFEFNVVTNQFSIKSDYLSRPDLLIDNSPPDQYRAVEDVKSLLRSLDLLTPDIATVSGEVTYLKVSGAELTQALSFSDADYARVDLRRNPVNSQYQFYTPEGETGIVYAIVSGALSGIDSIVKMEYYLQLIDYTQLHTYPLRTVQSAWKLLQAGEGYVASETKADTAIIRDVYLGYFDSYELQEYMQPIYVFSGDDGFLGYVPALDPEFTR